MGPVNAAQTAWAVLTGLLVIAGCVLVGLGEYPTGWPLIALGALGYVALGAMIVADRR